MRQEQALQVLQSGANVFLTGEPGAGKTHTIGQYVGWLKERGKDVAVTASTGIAASHLGGRTIHSWSGIGVKDVLDQEDIAYIVNRGQSARRISDADVLVIDEVSMLNGDILDSLDSLFRAVRVSMLPFGGMQVVFVGDFFQLPPISRGEQVSYAFESVAWDKADLQVCYLTEQHRQADTALLDLLRAIRRGDLTDKQYAFLCEQGGDAYTDHEPTVLHAHNREVDRDNLIQLDALPGAAREFAAETQGPKRLVESLLKGCTSPEVLRLKEGALVMCTKNNPKQGFVNGTLGTVTGFNTETGLPIIESFDGSTIFIEPMEWGLEDGGEVIASIRQVPLRLAWAITIHKSQGASLDAAVINLSKVFEEGQGYVALSRVRSLAGLQLVGAITPKSLAISPVMREKDIEFQEASRQVAAAFTGVSSEAAEALHKNFSTQRPVKRRSQKKDTRTITLEMLREGKTLGDIVATRGIQEKTVLNHVEQLADAGTLRSADFAHLLPDDWDAVYAAVHAAIQEHGDERLKPLYEHCGGAHAYPLIILARVTHRLQQQVW